MKPGTAYLRVPPLSSQGLEPCVMISRTHAAYLAVFIPPCAPVFSEVSYLFLSRRRGKVADEWDYIWNGVEREYGWS